MVSSTARDFGEYLAEVPPDRRAAMTRLREIARRQLPGYEERMAFGMPSYFLGGAVAVAFASQKRHLAVYLCRPGFLESHRKDLSGLDVGKGCIRFDAARPVDFPLIERLIQALATEDRVSGAFPRARP